MTNLNTLLLVEKYQDRLVVYQRYLLELDPMDFSRSDYLLNQLQYAIERLGTVEQIEPVIELLAEYECEFFEFLKKIEK